MRDHRRRVYDSVLGLRCDAENPTPLGIVSAKVGAWWMA